MKAIKFHWPAFNPFYTDLLLVLVTGILVSAALVTVGYTVIAQL
ncbi:MAG: hypothetical protein SH819_10500 [Cytophagales bacterium]|nr:hypothetical protein [Cytophagales bacterium]